MPTIINRKTWGAATPTNRTHVDPSRRKTFIVHYDDAKPTTATGSAMVRSIQNYHMASRGWADIGYNFIIDLNGNIYEGRGWDILGAHSGPTGNVEGIGVQCHIGGNQKPSTEMLESLRWLYEQANKLFKKRLTVKGHRDYMSTSCPGEPLYDMITKGTLMTSTPITRDRPPNISFSVFMKGVKFKTVNGVKVIDPVQSGNVQIIKSLLKREGFLTGTVNAFWDVDAAVAYAKFQMSLGYTGKDADGVPGRSSFNALVSMKKDYTPVD